MHAEYIGLDTMTRVKKANVDVNAMIDEIFKVYGLESKLAVYSIAYADSMKELNDKGEQQTFTVVGNSVHPDPTDGIEQKEFFGKFSDIDAADLLGVAKGLKTFQEILEALAMNNLKGNKKKKFSFDGDESDEMPEALKGIIGLLAKVLSKSEGGSSSDDDDEKPKKKKKPKPKKDELSEGDFLDELDKL